MKKKIDILREFAAQDMWDEVIKLAASFQQLGSEKKAILQAREAVLRPQFQLQLGRIPDVLIREGIQAIKAKYQL